MANREDLKAAFGALQHLKQNHLIGSLDAWRYVRVMRWYESLVKVAKNKGVEITTQQVDAIITILGMFVREIITRQMIHQSTTKNFSLFVNVNLVPSFSENCLGAHKEESKYKDDYLWEVDYEGAFHLFVDHISAKPWIMKGEASGISVEILQVMVRVLMECTQLVRGGEKHPYAVSQFCKASGKGFWGAVQASLDSSGLDFLVGDEEATLKMFIEEDDVEGAYKILRDVELRGADESMKQAFDRSAALLEGGEITNAEKYLHSADQVYDRAVREYSLKRIEVEREIAYNLVFHDSANRVVDSSVILEHCECWQKKRESRKVQLARLVSLNAPRIVIENEKRSAAKAEYAYLALTQNRAWLARVFGAKS